MQIGELATKSGFSRDTIRYYEQRGLLVATDTQYRTNGYKDYGPKALERLRWIDALKQHGFSLSEIRSLAPRLESAADCGGMPAVLSGKLAELDEQIRELEGFRARVSDALAHCRGAECDELPLAAGDGSAEQGRH